MVVFFTVDKTLTILTNQGSVIKLYKLSYLKNCSIIMILNITLNEERKFYTPSILYTTESRMVISLISLRVKLHSPITESKFLCLRTNLIDATEANPHQILTFLTPRAGASIFTHMVFQKQEYKLNNRNLSEGFFILSEVGVWDEIELDKGALQIHIEKKEIDT